MALLNRDILKQAPAYNNSEGPSQVSTDRTVATLQTGIDQQLTFPLWPSPVYCLLDVYEDQNIIDRNMNMILNRIRLIKSGNVFETFGNGWTLKPFDKRHSAVGATPVWDPSVSGELPKADGSGAEEGDL